MNSIPFRNPGHLSRARIFTTFVFATVASALNAEPPANVKLPANAKGAAAVAALGAHLPTVANAYGLEANKLATLFQIQPSLGVDVDGALFFACEGLAVSPSDAARAKKTAVGDALTATSSVTQLAGGGSVDAFQLHSLPGATRVIYLDFDGHTTTGTQWNSSYTGGAAIVSAPFDIDGDPSTFNDTERAIIQGVWRRVAEDYAPFAIDVTTQDPGVEALRKTTSSDNAYGVRVVISPTSWYGGAGGVAYIGSFNWNSDTPVWIFSGNLANHDKYMGEAASHEVGHSLGLYHDGVGGSSASEYYYGQGNWAPIMGVGYYKGITQFSKGDYANATNTQDDVAVIATYAPLVGDDHGNTLAAATVLAGPTVANGGTIETRSDVDIFRFDTNAGAILLNVVSPANESDLHMKVELLNSSGQVIQSNDASSMTASFSPTLAAGTYYLRISGIGSGDPLVDGYSDYGSLGNYVITGAIVPISGKQSPTVVASSSVTTGTAALTVNFSAQASDPDGSIVSYAWDFGNGTTASGSSASCTYTSAGGYTAVVTVTDNDGLSSSSSVFISVTAPANRAPTAVASANTLSGTAPAQFTFSSAGSADSDGSIASYAWNFGDGTTSTAANPVKTYSTPGTFNVVLTVTDNLGATATASLTVTVASDPNAAFDVADFTLTKTSAASGVSANAVILISDRAGRAVANATVTITWSGVVSGTSTGKTDASGKVTIASAKTKKGGTITGTVKSVTAATATYDTSIFTASTTQSIATK